MKDKSEASQIVKNFCAMFQALRVVFSKFFFNYKSEASQIAKNLLHQKIFSYKIVFSKFLWVY